MWKFWTFELDYLQRHTLRRNGVAYRWEHQVPTWYDRRPKAHTEGYPLRTTSSDSQRCC